MDTETDLAVETAPAILPINQIGSMDEYLRNYGAILGRKAIHSLSPLHVHGRDPLLDFDDSLRPPLPGQANAITATVKMFSKVGSGFLVGEMGTGKTIMGVLACHKHAQPSRKQGGTGGKYRAIVLCPDHLIDKWCREITDTIDGAIVTRFGPQGFEESDEGERKTKKGKKRGKKEDAGSKQTLRDVTRLIGGFDVPKTTGGDESQGKGETYSVSTGVDTFEDRPLTPKKSSGQVIRRLKMHGKPKGAEWYVLGRNQAKWLSDWAGIGDEANGFDGKPKARAVSSRSIVIKQEPKLDENGQPMHDKRGCMIMTSTRARVHYCPSCGTICRDKKGVPLGPKDLDSDTKNSTQKTCRGTYAIEIPHPNKPGAANGARIPLSRNRVADPDTEKFDAQFARFGDKRPADPKTGRPADEFNHGGKRYRAMACKEPLWNYTSRPYRWSPARIIQRKLRQMFKYLVIDEIHEHKSDESGQSMACSKLIGAVDHAIGLTGTIIGGYANHMFPLLMRIAPKSLKAEGFVWGKDMPFSEKYGRIDRIVTTKEEDDAPSVRGKVNSMRRAKSGSRSERKAVRPGIMPTMFGNHMIGSSIFIKLEEMSEGLPDLFEYVGGAAPKFAADPKWSKDEYESAFDLHSRMEDGWFDVACDMEPDQRDEYKRVMATLEAANTDLLRRGSMKLLGNFLWTGLDYPDRPFGWGHDPDVIKDMKSAHKKTGDVDDALAKLKLTHTVGYWDKPGSRKIENYVGVVTPKDCPEDVIYPKEQALIDICLKQKKDGPQTWVYVNMTGKRSILGRLEELLTKAGLKVGVLESDDVPPIERERWITSKGRDYDVMLSHPQLVSTGLDLFSKAQGGHNYSTIVFYETGYNLFTMRQAARRAWRIGQPRDCRIYYLYYKETMQHKAMALMSKKLAAAQALEGEFSADGLAAMAGEDNLQMALAKNLSERISDKDMQRGWSKVKSNTKRKLKLVGAIDMIPVESQAAINASVGAQLVEEFSADVRTGGAVFMGVVSEEQCRKLSDAIDALEPEPIEILDPANMPIPTPWPTDDETDEELRELVPSTPFADFPKDEVDVIAEGKPKRTRKAKAVPDQTVLQMPEVDTEMDEDYGSPLPELTEEILAKMFANMVEHGLMSA